LPVCSSSAVISRVSSVTVMLRSFHISEIDPPHVLSVTFLLCKMQVACQST
jgi:hypothetical protein